jgi:hypothetical protein
MSRKSILDPLKLLIRSPSGKRFRCNWCRARFDDNAQLLNHTKSTIAQTNWTGGRECILAFRCDWCDARFDTLFGLSEHIRGTTRDSGNAKQMCLPDAPSDSGGGIDDDGSLENPDSKSDRVGQAHHEIRSLPELQQAKGVGNNPSRHQYETIDEEDEGDGDSTSLEPVKVEEQSSTAAGGNGHLDLEHSVLDASSAGDHSDMAKYDQTMFYHPGISHRPLPPPPPATSTRPPPPVASTSTYEYEYWRNVPSNQLPMATPSDGSRTFDTFGSTRTFATARTSSFASYRTAPSFSHRAVPRSITELVPVHVPAQILGVKSSAGMASQKQRSKDFAARVRQEVVKHQGSISPNAYVTMESILSRREYTLVTARNITVASVADETEDIVDVLCGICLSAPNPPTNEDDFKNAVGRVILEFVISIYDLAYMADNLDGYFCETYGYKYPLWQKQSPISRTEWRNHLISRGLMLDPLHELDWSGRGQHVEYEEQHEKDIPLTAERILGYSATAVVESVMCRRIRLARKSIKCTRKLTKVDYIAEVEHLHRLQHAHILRVVGTYTFKKGLAILLYPVASWNLDEFMDELLDTQSSVNSDVLQSGWRDRAGAKALRTAFGCLAHALHFIHSSNVKHMDIKPKNILVRAHGPETGSYKIYIADFGIARGYKSANDAETDSPIPFTRTYAAPEVAVQDTRGFSADIFSLGCVFLEMIATLISNPALNQRQRLADARTSESGDTSYHANLGIIQEWHRETVQNVSRGVVPLRIHDLTSSMMQHASHDRISTAKLDSELSDTFCSECYAGPEPFEVAEDLS